MGCIALSGCGVVYVSSQISEADDGMNVRVLPISAETVLIANRQPYAPRSLPGAYFQTAGSGNVRGASALPEPPQFPPQVPGALNLRLPPTQTRGPYRLGAGDVLKMAIASTEEVDPLSGGEKSQTALQELTVRDDGAVSIPRIGAVQVAGLTVEEAEAIVFRRLIDSGIEPTFSLEVAEFNSQLASVGGAVRSPAVLPLTLNPLALGQALTSAGGVQVDNPEFASIRLYRDGELYQIPLEDFFARGDLQALPVLPGDAIYVDTTYDLDRAQAFYESQIDVIALRRIDRTAALSELQTEIDLRRLALEEEREVFTARDELGAVERDYVFLAGEVTRQSRWPLPFGRQASLADVLYDAGGLNTTTGNPAQIYVLRASTNPAEFGAVTAWHLNAANAAAFTLAPRFEMRPNDVVFVEEQLITAWNRTIQQSIPSFITGVAVAAQ